jgi:hypothetical protein
LEPVVLVVLVATLGQSVVSLFLGEFFLLLAVEAAQIHPRTVTGLQVVVVGRKMPKLILGFP